MSNDTTAKELGKMVEDLIKRIHELEVISAIALGYVPDSEAKTLYDQYKGVSLMLEHGQFKAIQELIKRYKAQNCICQASPDEVRELLMIDDPRIDTLDDKIPLHSIVDIDSLREEVKKRIELTHKEKETYHVK